MTLRCRGAVPIGLILSLVVLAALIGLFILHQGGKSKAETAQEFVEKYAQAWANKDASTIFKMQVSAQIVDQLDIRPDLKKAIRECNDEKDLQEIRVELKRGGMWYHAWAETRYSKERIHGDHIHVEVTVHDIPSEIVLVHAGKYLKVVTNPGLFD
jgi:hypothetical protein